MADTLYPAAGQLLQGSAQTALGNAELEQKKTQTTVQAGEAASSELGADRRQMSSQQAQQKLVQMQAEARLKGEMITITPQLALGLVKNTGDKGWLQAAGQSMRADVYTSLYTHGMDLAYAKKAPKITQIYDENGKIRHAVVYTDEQGNQQQLMLDAGMTPEKLHPQRPGAGRAGAANSMDFKKNQQFIRSYEKARGEMADPARASQLKSTNPDSYTEKTQWIKDNQDKYDSIVKSMGNAGSGGAAAPAAGGGGAAPDNAPFDADSFIKDALGK